MPMSLSAAARIAALATTMAIVLATAGCAPATYMESTRTDASPGPSGFEESLVASVDVKIAWPDDTRKLLVTTASSSGCPLTPQRFEGRDSTTLLITEMNGGGGACPADLHHYTFEVDRPASWIPGAELEGSGSDTRITVSVR
ncbi:hypothetical protein [Clavibacter michiganensis]|uniref:hypothetical protein n=1 Tax=Clavibacter michiganensis TaxID=28447 RepID=UPI003EBE9B89